jgi:phenylacetate-CoA ligase
MMGPPRSADRDIVWPAIVADAGASLLALAFQLEQSQWWSAAELQAQQFRQLANLLRHARATVPWYRQRLAETGLTDAEALTPEGWLRMPLLRRPDVRRHQAELLSSRVPTGHGKTRWKKTSGSTGEPLEVLGTVIENFMWQGLLFREDRWHRRDLRGRFVAIRSGRSAQDPLAVKEMPSWRLLSSGLYQTGPMTVLYHLMPVPQQAEVLEARSPSYLLLYPSNARALCRHARGSPLRLPDLEAVLTYGEPVPADVRTACRATWGVPVQDVYSCEELGYIAVQCPEHEHYHVQSESVLVEILDEQGRPCLPGQVGRVVLTALHNFAMPLIRYVIGDYAEVGEACPCGRGLPVLERILGRRRTQVVLPDRRRTWPDTSALWAAIPEVDHIQLLQRSPEQIEVRFARPQPLGAAEEGAARDAIHRALGHPFRLAFCREESIGRQPNGKYETFRTLLDDPESPR